MKKLELSSFKKKNDFEFYKNYSNPCYSVVTPIDVTNLYRYANEFSLSFYYCLIYLSIKAMETVPEFTYRIREDGVYACEHIVPSFTDMKKGDTEYYIVTTRIIDEDIVAFNKKAKEVSLNQTVFCDDRNGFEEDEFAYISCLPWFDFTSLVEEQQFSPNHSIPHLSWSKYTEVNGRKVLHYEILVNHRLIDGYRLGLFINQLQKSIDNL